MAKRGKVLLIIHDVYQEDNDFPSGPAYIASVLAKEGVDVRICCQDVFHYSNEELVKSYLENESYDIIGVGFLAARFRETVLGLCKVINENKKGAWLVLGGQGPSALPDYMIQTTGADIVAVGDAEETILDLVRCKQSAGADLSKVDGIVYNDNGKVAVNKRRKPIQNLDNIPFPAWDLLPTENYASCCRFTGMKEDEKSLAITASRGCINRCNFCYRMECGIRFRSIGNVIAEMKYLCERYGVTHFSVLDELFVATKRRVVEFKDAILKSGLKIKYICSARVDIFDDQIADSLVESGCNFVNFGMESSDQKVLDLMGKRTTVQQNIDAAITARKAGLGIGLNFIWGNLGDTEASMKGNVKLIKEFNTYDQLRTIKPVTPYPGCDLYYEAIKKGLLSGHDDFFDKFKNSDRITVNYTDLPESECYRILFDANKELILDHYEHTTKDMDEANYMIDQFHKLYFEGQLKFRGARHYNRKKTATGN